MTRMNFFRVAFLALWMIGGLACMAFANASSDSVIVNFGKGGRMVLVLKDAADKEALKEIDFEKIVAQMSALLDSAKNAPNGTVVVKNELGEFRIYATPENRTSDRMVITTKDGFRIQFGEDDDDVEQHGKHESFTDLYLGLNNYLENGSIPTGQPYSMRPLGARYFEMAFRKQARVGGDKSPLFFNYAISLSWYNFMFNGNNRLVLDGNGQPSFVVDNEHNLRKSKLTVAYVNVPLMLKVRHKKFSFAAGGYVGYRLGSSTKVQYRDEDGRMTKDKIGDPFALENVRYGLRAEINWIGPTIFANYDMNTLFTADSGMPKLNVLSFGIKL